MAVSNERILQKMMQELSQAKQNQHNQTEMLKNIENIRLLCDLFLPDDQPGAQIEKPAISSEVEWKAMTGKSSEAKSIPQQTFKKSIELDDEGNGDSIFDF